MAIIDLSSIKRARYSQEPYECLCAEHFIKAEAVSDLQREFPNITKLGYLTVDEVDLRGRFKKLIDELEGPELTEALSQRFGQDLHKFPRLTTIIKRSPPEYRTIHTDGPSKVMTLLVYMDDERERDESGRLQVLCNGRDYEPFALKIPETTGSMFAFVPSDKSWHGHLRFAGERRVVQVAWVKRQADFDRTEKNNKVAALFKGIFGR
jgi:hypothetical protein